MRYTTVPSMFLAITDRFRKHPDKPAYLYKEQGQYVSLHYDELRAWVIDVAMGFRALGVRSGDRVGIASENRIEWIVTDFAVTALGAADVPVFSILTPEQEQYIFSHCEAKLLVVSNRYQLNKILQVLDQLPAVEKVVVYNEDLELPDDDRFLTFAQLRELGRQSVPAEKREALFQELAQQVKPDDLLTIIYTSGTTGNPKGVMLTHRNVLSNVEGASSRVDISENDLLLSYLPFCHSYERTAGYYTAFSCGATVALAESIETIAKNMQEVRPTVMTSVPRLFERIQQRILNNVSKQPPLRQRIFYWALEVGKKKFYTEQQGRVPVGLRLQHQLADRLVFAKIRERTGGRLRFFISGGAPLVKEVGEFFFALGIPIYEGYGLTEASPVISVNYPGNVELGTVGPPLPNVEVEIADDGEILARGPNIMKGYFKDPAATQEAIDPDGWLHTGDIGYLNDHGRLVITDRKKNIFVSSGGKNIAPQPIENALILSPYIDQAVLIGDGREYNVALIVPDFEQLKEYAEQANISYANEQELIEHPEIKKLIDREIKKQQKTFSKYEQVRKFALLVEPFSVDNGMLTPTLKVRRHIIEQKYGAIIEQLYQ